MKYTHDWHVTQNWEKLTQGTYLPLSNNYKKSSVHFANWGVTLKLTSNLKGNICNSAAFYK